MEPSLDMLAIRCSMCARDFPSRYYMKTEQVCSECFQKLSPEEQSATIRAALMKTPMTSTTFTIEGQRITQQLGVVRGVTVRSRSVFGTIGAALQTVIGGNISLLSELCETTRAEAFDMMYDHAMQIGANAVVGIRYDATEVMDGVTEVLCYGTAVIVESAVAK